MAKINNGALTVTNGKQPTEELTPAARKLLTEAGPTVRVLANSRMLGAQQIIDTIGQFNPNKVTMKQRDQMRRDPMIQMGLHYIRVPLIGAPYHFECSDPQVAEFARRAYDRIHVRLMMGLLSSLDYGYCGIVKRFEQYDVTDWTYTDPDTQMEKKVWPSKNVQAIVWNDPRTLPPRGLHPMFNPKGEDKFIGMRHDFLTKDLEGGQELEIDADHSAWFTNERDQSFGDWYGYPRTGYALRYWWSYWYNWLLGDRHFEQDADPPLVVKVPEGMSVDPDDPTKIVPNTEIGLRLGQYLRDGATVAIPSAPYESETGHIGAHTPQWELDFLRGGENMKAFQDRFEYLDVMKLRAIMVPEQALVEGKGGTSSRNVAATFGAVFAEAQKVLSSELDQHINDYWIPDLIRQNFVDPPEVKKVTTGFDDEDISLVTAILTAAATADFASLHINMQKLLESVDIPTLTPEEIEEEEHRQAAKEQAAVSPFGQQQPPAPPGQPPRFQTIGGPGGGQQPPARGAAPPGQQQPAGGAGGVTIDGVPLAASLDLDLGSVPDIDPYQDPQMRDLMARLYQDVEHVLEHVYTTK